MKTLGKAFLKKIQGIKVENMLSDSGNEVPNQFRIRIPGVGRCFQSYSTLIVVRTPDGQVFLDESSWDYSATTGRYRGQFLGEGIAETRKKIASGVYKLVNLN